LKAALASTRSDSTYACSMPSPIGPVPGDPNDPDLWDWGEVDDELRPRRHLLRAVLAGLLVLSLVLLLVVSVL